MDMLPAEIITVIMLYCRHDCIKLSATCKIYQTTYRSLIKNIKRGYIIPELWLNTSSSFDISKYRRCVDDFYLDTTLWTINGVSAADKVTNLSYYLTAQCVFVDIHDEGYWLFFGKSQGYYVFFEANYESDWYWHTDNYDFTDGTFAYSQDWKQLWINMLSKDNRRRIMVTKDYVKSDAQCIIDCMDIITATNVK